MAAAGLAQQSGPAGVCQRGLALPDGRRRCRRARQSAGRRARRPMTALPVPADRPGQLTRLDQLAAIPEEEIWLAKQKSPQTRRAYRLDVRHFVAALGITTTDA